MEQSGLQGNRAAQLLVDNYPLIRQLVRRTARRNRLPEAERQDFESWVSLRLVERDFHILRSFAGRSSLTTYLQVVLSRCLLDFRSAAWGKWRPSAAARRLGCQAIALERLVTRDGVPREAAAARVGIDANVLPRFARRSRPRINEPLELAREAPAPRETGPEEGLLALDRQVAADALERALAQALATLGEADHKLLWLRYGARLTVPKIAARLGEDQKSLYRKYMRLHATMRTRLEGLGITRAHMAAVIGAPDVWLRGLLKTPSTSAGPDRSEQLR